MKLGNKIKRLREMHGLSQDDFALKMNKTKSQIGRIERDEVKVDFDVVEKASQVLGISIEDIINYDEARTINMMHNKIQNGNFYQQSEMADSQNLVSNLQFVISSQQKHIEKQDNLIIQLTEHVNRLGGLPNNK